MRNEDMLEQLSAGLNPVQKQILQQQAANIASFDQQAATSLASGQVVANDDPIVAARLQVVAHQRSRELTQDFNVEHGSEMDKDKASRLQSEQEFNDTRNAKLSTLQAKQQEQNASFSTKLAELKHQATTLEAEAEAAQAAGGNGLSTNRIQAIKAEAFEARKEYDAQVVAGKYAAEQHQRELQAVYETEDKG